MSIEKITYVHELLFRFDRAGFKAAHIARAQDLEEDGILIPGASTLLDPQPVTADDAATLAEISGVINASALADNAAKDAQITALTAERDAALADKSAALAQVESLHAQLLEYQTPTDANGVPKEVTMRQAQLALLGAGLLDDVEAAIAAIPGDAGRAAQITWTKSSAVLRTNPLIAQLSGALGLTSDQLDAMFIAASKL